MLGGLWWLYVALAGVLFAFGVLQGYNACRVRAYWRSAALVLLASIIDMVAVVFFRNTIIVALSTVSCIATTAATVSAVRVGRRLRRPTREGVHPFARQQRIEPK